VALNLLVLDKVKVAAIKSLYLCRTFVSEWTNKKKKQKRWTEPGAA